MTPAAAEAYWSLPHDRLLAAYAATPAGLATAEADRRLAAGASGRQGRSGVSPWRLLARQFESPLVLILVFGASLSLALRGWADAIIVLTIVVASALLGFFQEYHASNAVRQLQSRLALQARVRRDGRLITIAADRLVPGDVLELAAGALVPADGVILEATDFLVTEAALTGESLPVEKRPASIAADTPLPRRSNCVFAGTSVRSGFASVLVTATGDDSELGDVARLIEQAAPETGFERGIRRFGYLLIRIMLVMVVAVMAAGTALGRPVMESLLFAVALAVGMTPELLPAIVTVTLSAGARMMAGRGVIVRRLASLENLGGMDILCTDKTGTLTAGTVALEAAIDAEGAPSAAVAHLGFLNAAFETGIDNPLDQALIAHGQANGLDTAGYAKRDEIPYDFMRRRLTIVATPAAARGSQLLVSKGAVKEILSICTRVATGKSAVPLDAAWRARLDALVTARARDGFRLLALASADVADKADYTVDDERDLTLRGFLLFSDPPKAEARATLDRLAAQGVAVKVISGDNRGVALHVAAAVGLAVDGVLTGAELAAMSPDALAAAADRTTLFCETDPQQKERIILALQKRGHVVGYLGDGINDAPALHAADVGISVDQAVDVARQSADIVLLERDLGVLSDGIACGRHTFANTQKYIAITSSANFGNMISMALATPFLPFLPLLAKQILFNNFLSDIPSLTISSDNVDRAATLASGRWDLSELRRFMVVFGLVSSVFDLLTFVLLLKVLAAGESEFQTAWFTVSLLTEVLVVLSLRTRLAAWKSRPSAALLWSTLAVTALALGLPYVRPVARLFDFTPLPLAVTAALLIIALTYVAATEATKVWFYRSLRSKPA